MNNKPKHVKPRKPETETFHVRLDSETKAMLVALAEADERRCGDIIRRLIREAATKK